MKNPPLIDVLDVVPGGIKSFTGNKEYIDTKNVQNHQIINPKKITYQNKPSRANMQVMEGDVLIAKMKETSKVLFIDESNCDYIYSTGFAILRPHPKKLRSRYLYHWFNFNKTQKLKDKWARGGTQKAINNTKLKTKMTFPIVDIEVQDKIIEKFDKIDSFLTLIGHQMIEVDKLLQKKRNEFFSSTKNLTSLKKLFESPPYRYPTFYGFKYVKSGIRVLKISNMTDNAKFNEDDSSYDYITEKINERFPKTVVKLDDMVIEVRGTYIGKTAKITPKFVGSNISPNTVRIALDKTKIIPSYFWHFTFSTSWKNQIEKRARYWKKKFGTIIVGKLDSVEIPLPEIEGQKPLVEQLDLLDKIYALLMKSYDDCNLIYQTEMNDFFAKL